MAFGRMGARGGFGSEGKTGGGSLSWIPNPTNRPDIVINWASNQAWTKTGGLTTPSALGITTSRASVKQVVDANGNWTQIAANTTATSNLGRSTEEARTNSIRNNTMVGAVVGADNVELLTNGNFAAQGTGWTAATASGGSVTFNTGSVVITGDGATFNNNISRQITGLTPGRSYVVVITSPLNTIAILVDQTTAGAGGLANVNAIGNGNGSASPDRAAFTAPANGTVVLSLARFATSPATLNSVSVQDGERVENGGFTVNPINASQSTVQNGWQWSNNVGTGTVVYSGNTVQITGDGTHTAVFGTLGLSTVAGFTYTITADITGNNCNINVGTTAFNTALLSASSAVGVAQKFQFTATTSTTFISFAKTSAVTATIANVSVQSAGVGPTNWQAAVGTGLVISVVGTGTQNGIDYIDYRYAGTTTGTFGQIVCEQNTQIAALATQVWSQSWFAALVGGSTTNIGSMTGSLNMRDAGGVSLGSINGVSNYVGTISPTLQRVSGTGTLTNGTGTTAFVAPIIGFGWSSGVAIDFTVRIGWPQIEQGASVTSPIKTTSAAVTRAADVTSLTQAFGSAYSMFSQATPQTPVGYTSQWPIQFNNGTAAERSGIRRVTGTSVVQTLTTTASVDTIQAGVAWAQNASGKVGYAVAAGAQQGAFNGTLLSAGAAALPTTPTTINFGHSNSAQQWNGLTVTDAIWLSALSSPELQAITT